MFSKFYEKVKTIIKEEYKTIIFFGILYFIVLCPVNYYIITGGGTVDIKDRVVLDGGYKSKGSMRLAYVSELKGTIFTYGLSFIVPSWKAESLDDYKYENDEKASDINFRDELDLKVANEEAIHHAYTLAGKNFKVTDSKFYLIFVEKHNKKFLKVGDEILEINGEKVISFETVNKVVSSCNEGDKVRIKLKRGSKVLEKDVEVYRENGDLLIGVMMQRLDSYEENPKIELKFKKSESGPSGGMMLTLDIYNKLTKKDITGGLDIVGTGTIEEDGSVGEIGGVTYKLMGAVKDHADIFIAPSGNYKEAVNFAKSKNYKIKIIEAKNIKQVLKELEKVTK